MQGANLCADARGPVRLGGLRALFTKCQNLCYMLESILRGLPELTQYSVNW